MPYILPNWAQSSAGHSICLYASQDFKNLKPQTSLLCIGGVHGDEPEGIFLAEALLKWLKSHNESSTPSPARSTLNSWVLISCLNVDGAVLHQRTNKNGVDLNRNFPSIDWSSQYSAERYYPGPQPASEPEVQALVRLIKEISPKLIIHFHSWKPALIFSGPDSHPAPLLLSQSSGYPLQKDIGYPTPGSLGQWAWGDLKIPVICTEEREGASEKETWARFGPGLQKIFEDLHRFP